MQTENATLIYLTVQFSLQNHCNEIAYASEFQRKPSNLRDRNNNEKTQPFNWILG